MSDEQQAQFTISAGTEDQTTLSGSVPATLALSLAAPPTFGVFTPGVARTHTAATTATVVSSAGDASLSVTDSSAHAPGHLVNGAFSLPSPVKVSATSVNGTALAGGALSGGGSPTVVAWTLAAAAALIVLVSLVPRWLTRKSPAARDLLAPDR